MSAAATFISMVNARCVRFEHSACLTFLHLGGEPRVSDLNTQRVPGFPWAARMQASPSANPQLKVLRKPIHHGKITGAGYTGASGDDLRVPERIHCRAYDFAQVRSPRSS
jgi:hypothetical protein